VDAARLGFPVLKGTVGPVLRLAFRPWVQGREHVPTSGPAIIASNHRAFADSVVIPLMAPRRVTFPAKKEYFVLPGIKGRAMAAFFAAVGAVPVDRDNVRASIAAIDTGVDVLAGGDLFGIYPEGTRSPDGRLYRGRTGVAHIALRSGAPVIPTAVFGTEKVQPNGKIIPNLVRVAVRFGPPLDFSRHAGMDNNRHIVRAVTDEIMDAIRDLSGQDYVDRYARRAGH